ncbi:MAG TPA: GNAT family N-acetyltransferase [Acidovorax sp.]|jgi:hypothetical protein|nr:GNAT family N-acetyltransferase [Acidovorax sp.]
MKMVLAPESLDIAGQRFSLRDLAPEDMADVLALHREVFGSRVDTRWFHWKYVAGQGEGVGLWRDAQLIAFCGGTPRQVLHRGVPARWLQIGDVMVSPAWRGLFTRKSPFFHVSERFYRSRLGRDRDFSAGFGFPNPRHLRLAVKSGLSHDAGEVGGLQWRIERRTPSFWSHWQWRFESLDPGSSTFDTAVDRCWEHMRAGGHQGAIGVRDASYVRWRFVERPDKGYRFLALRRRWQSAPLGIAVLAQPTGSAEHLPWLDWVGPASLLPMAWALAMWQARRDGAAGLSCWASAAVAAALAPTRPMPMGPVASVGVPTASTLAISDVAALDCWWSGGDTDFL